MSETPLARWAFIIGSVMFSIEPAGGQQARSIDLLTVECPARESVALSDALSQLGGCVGRDYALFGLEEVLHDGKEPTVRFEVRPGQTVGTSLREILAQLPPYELEVVSGHLIDLRPVGAKNDPNNILNMRVPRFDAVAKPAMAILNAPRRSIPELEEALKPKPEPGKQVLELYFGGYHGDLLVTLHLADVTVRDVLDATVVASERSTPEKDPDGWVYAFDPNPPEGKSKHSWKALYSLPRDWRFRKQARHDTVRH